MDDEVLDDALTAARPGDAPGRLLARSKVAAQLFGAAAGGLGRFRVLERLGGGGMGVVYAAYDPQLDRGVAIKTVHVPSQSREVALREAKALARLSHPNIVPVFDVGIAGDDVYIVMELVRGETLRAWAPGKSASEIAAVYRQAAAGLAAAHDAGFVHRDFKPENAIVGDDGRVRVVDFGLAAAPDATVGRAGTPAYMAPEQTAGEPLTPAVDQYSLCIALREAVAEPRPAWLDAIIARGTADDPARRFTSMHELSRALGRDPRTIRRRRLLAVAAAAAVAAASVTAFVLGRSAAASVDACTGGAQELAATWSPADERVELARIASLSAYGKDLAARVADQVAAYRAHWIDGLSRACQAHRRGEQSDTVLDRRTACLDRSRAGFAAVAELARATTADTLPDLSRAMSAVPLPEACADVNALLATSAPPAAIADRVTTIRRDLERARVQIAAGHVAAARDLAVRCIEAARPLGYPALVAEASLVAGHAIMQTADRLASVPYLRDATTIGVEAGADALAAEAWARRTYVEATSGGAAKPVGGADVIEALAVRSGSPFARALLANNLGAVALANHDRAAARTAFERALIAARDVAGPGAVELVHVRENLALVADDPAERDRWFADAHDMLAHLLGPDHPDTLLVEWNRLMKAVASPAEAAPAFERLCARDELHPALARRTAVCLVELAELRDQLGDRPGAIAAIDRALALGAGSIGESLEAPGYGALWHGDAAAAARMFEAAIRDLAPTPDEPWFRIYNRAKLEIGLAQALRTLGRDPSQPLASAITGLTSISDQRAATIDRKLAAARALSAPASPTSRTPTPPSPTTAR